MTSLSMGELNAVDYCLAGNSVVVALAAVVAVDSLAVVVVLAVGLVVALAADYLL